MSPPRRWRRDSIFGDGPRVPLTRDERVRFKHQLRVHRCKQRLTADQVKVGEVLEAALGADGRLDLARETIAARAGCCLATVDRALKSLRALGLVDWTRRLIRNVATGWRAEQTTNAYWLRCETQSASADKYLINKKEGIERVMAAPLAAVIGSPTGVPDLLLARRRALEARWRAGLATR